MGNRGLTPLLTALKGLEEGLVRCMRCGMCQSVCPLYGETGLETDVARGKLSLIKGLLDDLLRDPKKVEARLNRCLLCGSCQANCPSGVRVIEIFLQARIIISASMGLGPMKRLILRGILAHPFLFDRLFRLFKKVSSILFREADPLLKTSCARIPLPGMGDRHVRLWAPPMDSPKTRAPIADPKVPGPRVGVFVGCLIDKLFPSIRDATIGALRYHKCQVIVPEGQGCCGIPALSTGDLEAFYRLVGWNLRVFYTQRLDFIVSACPTCTWTIKELWPMFAKRNDQRQKIQEISAKTFDINRFVTEKFKQQLALEGGTGNLIATYHDPCHLKKSLGIWEEPRMLLKTNPKIRLVEMPQSDSCCGMGGSFSLRYYKLSFSIARRKRDSIMSTNPALLTTACPACMFQFYDILSKNGAKIRIQHSIETYLEGIMNT